LVKSAETARSDLLFDQARLLRLISLWDQQRGFLMKSRFIGAAALAFALATSSAFAETAQFRSAAPQTFTAQDLQSYGLDESATARATSLQDQGYEIRVLSADEADQVQAGITDNQWLLIGILAGVVVIAVAVAD
jgi:hypothetical protein